MQSFGQISFYSAVFLSTLLGVNAQSFELGGCSNIQGVDYLNFKNLSGVWYEYARSSYLGEANSRCSTFIMKEPIQGQKPIERYDIKKFLFWEYERVFKANSTITGAGKLSTPDNFNVTYLAVDYDNYFVAYACQDLMISKTYVIWILTRERFPSCDVVMNAYNVVWEYGLNLDYVHRTNQKNCPDTWDPSTNIVDAALHNRG